MFGICSSYLVYGIDYWYIACAFTVIERLENVAETFQTHSSVGNYST
jgi:hypothetical protein